MEAGMIRRSASEVEVKMEWSAEDAWGEGRTEKDTPIPFMPEYKL